MNKEEVGKTLKQIREKKNLTQIEVSKRIKISQSLLSQYELGIVRNVNKRTLIKMLDVYEITPKYFEALIVGSK